MVSHLPCIAYRRGAVSSDAAGRELWDETESGAGPVKAGV